MTDPRIDADVIIVGSGPLGATVARGLRDLDPTTRILMFEGGGALGARPARHLLDATEPEVRAIFERRARNAEQAQYVHDSALDNLVPLDHGGELVPGVLPASLVGERISEFPGASFAWNVGGMGVHWTAACPSIDGPELIDAIPSEQWHQHMADADRLFSVTEDVYGATPTSAFVLGILNSIFPSDDPTRGAQTMPMAGNRTADGRFLRTGPADVFPPLGGVPDDAFELRSRTLCTSLLWEGRVATGVNVVDLATGIREQFRASVVVLAADALRTPQLMWASDIRPSALGRYLNEHATVSGSVLLRGAISAGTKGKTGPIDANEPYVGAYWLPSRGSDQPFHGQMMETVTDAGEHRVGLSWYLATQIKKDNRVEFSDTELDYFGMPAMRVHFAFSEADRKLTVEALRSQALAGHALGEFDESTAELLEAGSSLHYTGTVRMGAADDGTSVCDSNSQVWGFDNLFLAGNGVIPTAITCNTTITSVALALRAVPEIHRIITQASAAFTEA